MKNIQVVSIEHEGITFDDGTKLCSYHEPDCCESHYLDFADIKLSDFKDLYFDLTTDTFFERVEGYGIALLPIKGHPVRIPGYGSNNGYYSSDLSLVVMNADKKTIKTFDITDCQDYTPY